jgi:hypothetical protein
MTSTSALHHMWLQSLDETARHHLPGSHPMGWAGTIKKINRDLGARLRKRCLCNALRVCQLAHLRLWLAATAPALARPHVR